MSNHFIRGVVLSSLLVVLSGASQCGPSSIIHNASFDSWSGDELSGWRVDAGHIKKVASWHASDSAVDLMDTGTSISQATKYYVGCMEISMIGNIDTEVSVGFDVQDDGVVDGVFPLPAANWARVSLKVAMPPAYDSMRLSLTKSGSGKAVLAEFSVFGGICDEGGARIAVDHVLPPGATCEDARECASGRCSVRPGRPLYGTSGLNHLSCADCESDADCVAGSTCVAVIGERNAYNGCVSAVEQRSIGQFCSGNDECASGVCCTGVCAECCFGTTCGEGLSCKQLQMYSVPLCSGPQVAHALAPVGTPCTDRSQCASQMCEAVVASQPHDGACWIDARPCTVDTDCGESDSDQHCLKDYQRRCQ